MLRKYWIILLALSVVGVVGCGGETPETPAEPAEPGPQAAVKEFLEAVRNGDDTTTERMLTTAARTTTRSLGMDMAPSRSDTAQFEVGDVEFVTEDGARVVCTLSDLDANNQRQSETLVWMLRHEPEGWRIAGLAATLIEGEPPRKLDFENIEEMRALRDQGRRPPAQAQLPPDGAPGTIQR
ncbi:MAG TPA: hypothetical protein VE890_03210 [Thermoguttaceae bacterium]|nr:hypothetical protein [Thermoguttaceae bacterium]